MLKCADEPRQIWTIKMYKKYKMQEQLPDTIRVSHFSDDAINSINRLHIPVVIIAVAIISK